jgi:membrane dipeptidase
VQFSDVTVIDGLDTSKWGSESVYRALRDGGVTAINATIAIWDDYESTLHMITKYLEWFDEFDDLIRPVKTVEDIHRAKAENRTGIIFGWQNATPIGNDLTRLKLFHELGVRVIQLTYNERNLLGNGCYERTDDGLSNFGLAAVKEMNRLGILIDLSHVGDRTTLDAIENSIQPVAITHANARSHIDHPRSKTDEAIKLLVERGGVIGANGFPMFFEKGFETGLDEYIDAIDYLVQMVGIDHVGIGTDVSYVSRNYSAESAKAPRRPRERTAWRYFWPAGSLRPQPQARLSIAWTNWPLFTVGLVQRGYKDDEIRKIIGGNVMRVLGDSQR